RTLVVLAHHDAAPTGVVFDQSAQQALARRFPALFARIETSPPLWWLVAGPPALSAVGAAARSRRLTGAGGVLGVVTFGLGVDIARSPIVPGANDNLSACAALVALAEELSARPVEGLRVLLVSCGAEEVLQGGIYDFVRDRLADADRARTWVVNLDTIGSPELIMVEGEGPFRMEDYTDASLRDRLAALALADGAPLRRGLRSRSSTDAVVPSRAGFPTAMLASWDPVTKVLSNYHLMTDTPDRLTYATIARAVRLVAALARDLAPRA
ncbi:MAG TPA: M28 family peptidase, partial [Solirubrobacteraceae bacterium]|nr:M28 family peptidase [Solirubrobacteraceae bacterium]